MNGVVAIASLYASVPGCALWARRSRDDAFLVEDCHHLVRVASLAEQLCHHPHRSIDMREEGLVPGAQVVQARLAVRRRDEAILGTLTVTRESS